MTDGSKQTISLALKRLFRLMKIEVWKSYCTTLSLWQVAQKDVDCQLTEMYVTKVV